MTQAKKPRKITVTAKGVTVKIDPQAFDDYELFESVFDGQDNDMAILFKLMHAVCGDAYADVKDQLRDESGKLGIAAVSDFLTEVMAEAQALKN